MEGVVNKTITNEVRSFRDDITKARENDFGRRIFEAFANEYGTSYLNESKEMKKIQNTPAEMETKLAEANDKIAEGEDSVKLTESKLKVAEDRFERKEKLNELLAPLGKEKKEQADLLESVKTENLKSLNKYILCIRR